MILMLVIKCIKCGSENSLYLADPIYNGPFLCWKCKGTFSIEIANDKLKSCKPINKEKFDQLVQMEALKSKLKRQ